MLPTPQDINPDFPLPLRGGPGEPLDTERRYFLNFPGVNQYVSIPEVTLTGDFEISLEIYPVSVNTSFIGTATGIENRFRLRTGDADVTVMKIGFFGGSGAEDSQTESGFLVPNALNAVTVSRVGTTITALNNITGVTFSQDYSLRPAVINSIGQHVDVYWDSIIANVRISDNGTPVRFYPLDDNSTTIRDTIGGNDGTYINGAAADWGRLERAYGGDWQGQGLIVPPWESVNQILEVA